MDPPVPATTLIVIATCARPGGVSYLDVTAEKLMSAGADRCPHRVILVDGPEYRTPAGWVRYNHPKRQGDSRTMWTAFRIALESGAEQLLYCEDDIIPCRNAVRRMLALSTPDRFAFVDFHDMRELVSGQPVGLWPLQPGTFHAYRGNQCMLIPRRTLAWLVALHDPSGDPFIVGSDGVLGGCIVRSPWPFYAAHAPCIVRHVGEVSAAHPDARIEDGRLPTCYSGDTFDAATLTFNRLPTAYEYRTAIPRIQLPATLDGLAERWPAVPSDRCARLWWHYEQLKHRPEPARSHEAIVLALG
jgi:hypothetical protein